MLSGIELSPATFSNVSSRRYDKREMLSAAYVPRWIVLSDEQSLPLGRAVAFTIDRASEKYAGGLDRAQIVQRLATAAGALGSSAEYLFETCRTLRAAGIPDTNLESLKAEVAAIHASMENGP
jgi:cation transport protein ChaC